MSSRSRRRGVSRRAVLSAAAATLLGAGTVAAGVARLSSASHPATPTSPSPTPPSPSPPKPTPDLLRAARARIEKYVQRSGGRIALAVQDRTTGIEVAVGTRRFQTASIVKVDILAALLLRRQQQQRELGDADRRLARSMIVVSDNDSASTLWKTIGYSSGLAAANKKFGLRQTKPDPSWGMTTTTAADQVRLLAAITAPDGPLDAAGQKFLLGLMSQVHAEQRWGIPAAAGPDATRTYVKNGWTTVDTDANRWLVNSIGRIVEPGHDWLVAVLSDHHASQRDGIQAVEKLAKYALRELRALPPAPL